MVLRDNLETIPKEDLTKIFKGWVKAAEWTQDPVNWKEYMEFLNTQTFKEDDPYSEQDLQEMVAAVRIHNATTLLERNRDDGGFQAFLEDFKAFLVSNNLLKQDFEPKESFNNTTFVEVLNEYE